MFETGSGHRDWQINDSGQSTREKFSAAAPNVFGKFIRNRLERMKKLEISGKKGYYLN